MSQDIHDKLESLLKKTEENGCTRQEAEQALMLARRIAEKNQIDLDALSPKKAKKKGKIKVKTFYSKRTNVPTTDVFLYSLSLLTEVQVYVTRIAITNPLFEEGYRRTYKLFGTKSQIRNFVRLRKILLDTVEKEYQETKSHLSQRLSKADYIKGFNVGICNKAKEILANSKALVLVKEESLDKAFKKEFGFIRAKAGKAKPVPKIKSKNDAVRGFIASDKVELQKKLA